MKKTALFPYFNSLQPFPLYFDFNSAQPYIVERVNLQLMPMGYVSVGLNQSFLIITDSLTILVERFKATEPNLYKYG